MTKERIEKKQIESYAVFLREKYRPPSRGGNTKALHAHVLTVEGERYSFLAQGSQRWVFKSDWVTFEFEFNNGYRNIIKDTLVTTTSTGKPIQRGNRGYKPKLRTADPRMPASKREQRD